MIKEIIKRDGRRVSFKKEKIRDAIFKAFLATGEGTKDDAEYLTEKVVKEILKWRKVPHVEEVQDLVETTLMENRFYRTAKAYILYREQHKKIREVRSLIMDASVVRGYLSEEDWMVKENSNMTYSLQGLNFHISSKVVSHYWLNHIYPAEIRNSHLSGDLHIHDLGVFGPYTYYGKEVIVAKIDSRVLPISFEQLYELIDAPEKILNKEDEAYAKYPDGVFVLDRDGWTNVSRIIRKKKNRSMYFVKNRGGRSIIVTDNHPMITENGEKEAKDVTVGEDKTFTANLNNLLSKEKLWHLKEIDLLKEIKKTGWDKRERLFFNGEPLEAISLENEEDGYVHSISSVVNRRIKLTEKFGYFIGLTLAEGFLSYDEKQLRISLTQRDKRLLKRANQGLIENGMSGCIIKRKDRFELRVKNPFLRFLFDKVFRIKPGARNKTLPIDVLSYNKDFVDGLISGILDGDGSINTSGTTFSLRLSSRTMLEQIAVVMQLFGFTPRDRSIEGQGSVREFKGRKIVQNYPIYGLSFRKIDVEISSEKYAQAEPSTRAWHDENLDEWHKIINREETDIPDEFIYDITTKSGTLLVNGMWNHNCVGWDLLDLLLSGFKGVPGKVESRPAKHFKVALGQVVNFFYTLQGEAAGAQAFSNVDTYLSPFIRYDNLSYNEVKQAMQEFIFNLNVPTRVGFQTPFVNVTLDLKVPDFMKNEPVIIGGRTMDDTFGEFQPEMDMFVRAFGEVMLEGDAKGRPFTFPIPTLNITKDFDWDDPNYRGLWEMTAKYGIPYFSNFVSSDMKPDDVRSMCCRLRLDKRELKKRGGGLFGANPLTGSIGVVTINMPKIGFLSRDEDEYFERLDRLMVIAKNSLEIKRKTIENFTEKGLYPYSKYYLRNIKKGFNGYWKNHFSTIGLIGMNESILNFMNTDIGSREGIKFALRVLDYMRRRLADFQEETGNIYNLEATPAEGTSYRLAKIDKEKYPEIIVANNEEVKRGAEPYYTNSSQLPVNYTDDLFEALKLQDELQIMYTGGTVLHGFVGERLTSIDSIKRLVKRICENFRLPYFTITPTFSICPEHGYIPGEHETCPECGKTCEVYSRSVGYLRPVSQWNPGKEAEFRQRRTFKL